MHLLLSSQARFLHLLLRLFVFIFDCMMFFVAGTPRDLCLSECYCPIRFCFKIVLYSGQFSSNKKSNPVH